ncbi:AlpA family transcriptional regulator [Dietzia sp. WMMA184]|uniref:helix-turn-helix transcriptional regulator n=1 Tax=Dietzia sp. WMMA184 TaxID=2039808 RepID=UPI000BDE866D|nr:helix-turn-helix domain-containing protein [Dietzia sp. WMMA184]
MQETPTRHLATIDEARTALGGIGRSTLYKLVQNGELTKVSIGRRGFITIDSIDAYVDRLRGTAPRD